MPGNRPVGGAGFVEEDRANGYRISGDRAHEIGDLFPLEQRLDEIEIKQIPTCEHNASPFAIGELVGWKRFDRFDQICNDIGIEKGIENAEAMGLKRRQRERLGR